jgi:hypothetical protein
VQSLLDDRRDRNGSRQRRALLCVVQGDGGALIMLRITPVKIALLTAAYYFGYQFVAIYIAAACLIYTLIGDNTR